MTSRKVRFFLKLITAVTVLSLTGCSSVGEIPKEVPADEFAESSGNAASAVDTSYLTSTDMFTDRDMDASFEDGFEIELSDSGIKSSCNTLLVADSTVTVKDEGTYILSGSLSDGQIVVDADSTDKIQLVLNGVDITNDSTAPIYVRQADKVFITLGPDSQNSLSVTGEYVKIDENNIDAAIFSKDDLTLNGGSFVISTGDDGIHADYNTLITAGDIKINNSYEGIEGLTVDINGGNIELSSTDDGLNAAGGNDQSGFGRGNMQDMSSVSGAYIKITDGILKVYAQGDGIDSNGSLYVSGGETYVEGPENTGNGALDYNGTAEISGGTFIASGASGMAQGFGNSSTQGTMFVTLSGSMTGGEIKLSDSSGKTLLSYTPSKSYNCVILSCADIKEGNTYTLTAGGQTQTVQMTSLVYGSSGGFGGGTGGGKMQSGGMSPGGFGKR